MECSDFGARLYDQSIGRWMCPDPLTEKYYYESPYVYCGNNPMKYIDLDGEEKIISVDKNKDAVLYKGGMKFKDGNSIHIFAHGNSKGITVYNDGKNMEISTAKEFKKFLSENSKIWNGREDNERTTIVLHSCETAMGSNSFAKKISEELENATIIAPNMMLNISNKTYNELGTYTKESNTSKLEEGRWLVFERGKIISSHKYDWQPKDEKFDRVRSVYNQIIDFIFNK